MSALRLQGIGKRFGAQEVLRGLDLELADGDIGCLLGPSGCGKTTLLRIIAGLGSPDVGEVRIGEQLVAGQGRDLAPEARRVSMLFQHHALFPHLDALGNVAFGLHRLPTDQRRELALQALERVGLQALAERMPHELSGGQQQRVALARALAPRPSLILLDEPFSSLDAELRHRLGLEVRATLKDSGATALMVTHDQLEAFAVADQVGVMSEGVLQQWSPPYDLYHRPASREVAAFVGRGVMLPGEVGSDGRVHTELGEVQPEPGGTAPVAGDRVQVLLRPDDVVHDDDSEQQAEVVARVFRGADILYTLRLASGVELLSVVPSHHDHPLGEAIGIRLDAEHGVIFPAE